MQETVVYLKKITQPEGEKKELERELSQCGWELFRMGMQEQYLSLIHISEPTRPY